MEKLKENYKLMLEIEKHLKSNKGGVDRKSLYEQTKKSLKKEFSISKFDKAINHMRNHFKAPITQTENKKYKYENVNFCIEKENNFIEEDINIFKMLRPFFDTLKNSEFDKDLDNFIKKFNLNYNISRPIISFEAPVENNYAEKMALFYEYILQKKVVKIEYENYGENIQNFNFSPFLLKEYRNRWYVVGFNHEEEYINVLGLDRIKTQKMSIDYEYSEYKFNEEKFFKYSLGNTRRKNAKKQTLVLEFNELNKNYILSNKIHASQKIIKLEKDSLTISLELYDSHELRMLLLSYGSGVKVIKPKFYQEYLKRIANKVIDIYK